MSIPAINSLINIKLIWTVMSQFKTEPDSHVPIYTDFSMTDIHKLWEHFFGSVTVFVLFFVAFDRVKGPQWMHVNGLPIYKGPTIIRNLPSSCKLQYDARGRGRSVSTGVCVKRLQWVSLRNVSLSSYCLVYSHGGVTRNCARNILFSHSMYELNQVVFHNL